MTQHELNCAVADVTGEDVSEIRRLGFSVADPSEVYFDPEPDDLPPQVVDWDQHDLHRNSSMPHPPLHSLQSVA